MTCGFVYWPSSGAAPQREIPASHPQRFVGEQFVALAHCLKATGVAAGVQGRQKRGPRPRISAPRLYAAISHLDHQFVHFPHSETGRCAGDQLAHQRVPLSGSPPPRTCMAQERCTSRDPLPRIAVLQAGTDAGPRAERGDRAITAESDRDAAGVEGSEGVHRLATATQPLFVKPTWLTPRGIETGLYADRH